MPGGACVWARTATSCSSTTRTLKMSFQLAPAQRGDPGSPPGGALDQAVVTEPCQRLAHRDMADVELGCDPALDQAGTGLQRSVLDGRSQLRVGIVRDALTRQRAERLCHSAGRIRMGCHQAWR